MKIEFDNLFLKACKDGINIFTGSGFSIDAKDARGQNLPLGYQLSAELAAHFNLSPTLPLSSMSTILESSKKTDFYDYLKRRVNVSEFNEFYKNIELLNIKHWFTTNIDNLTERIFENSNRYYLNNNSIHGPSFSDLDAVEFFPLHGSILNDDRPLIFSSLSIASTFSSSPKLWNDLIRAIEKKPVLFWGYSLSDSGILQTLNSIHLQGLDRKDKWVVLYKEMPDEELYFKSLGFNIIIATNKELFDFFSKNLSNPEEELAQKLIPTKQLFHTEFVPSSGVGLPVREITEFFLGGVPTWSDIYSRNVYITSHFSKIQNLIFSEKNTIIVGTPASGKTTLLMQLSAFTEFNGHKIVLNYPTVEKAKNVINKLNGSNALIFVDNFTDDIQGFTYFNKFSNVKLVGFDREHNFEVVSHFVNRKDYNIYSVTTLSDIDIQELFNKIPDSIKNRTLKTKKAHTDEQASLFEFVSLNLKHAGIKERYKNVIVELEKEDELLTDFLLLSSYVHYCKTPLSFDMAYSYFAEYIGSYKEIYDLKAQLGRLIIQYIGDLVDKDEQDYFVPRSVLVAETIIENVQSKYLRRMLYRFVDNLPAYKISNYHIFKKKGHDKSLIAKAFPDWEEGKYYYEKLMQDDSHNPYLLQQGALYLSYKSRYIEAFYWIDKARNLTHDRVFSIRNSHAIILFEANIHKDSSVRDSLDRSMTILQKCYIEDKRKLYHAKKFSEQAIEYFDKFGDKIAKQYLDNASLWLDDELKTNDWNRGLKELKKIIENKRRNY
jgi:tetratricopeptide (TPR) repeat protein